MPWRWSARSTGLGQVHTLTRLLPVVEGIFRCDSRESVGSKKGEQESEESREGKMQGRSMIRGMISTSEQLDSRTEQHHPPCSILDSELVSTLEILPQSWLLKDWLSPAETDS